jgi:hypothetical protein
MPTLHQLQLVLEACLWEQQQRGDGLFSGLLLLSILLSAADPPVRLAFLAGVPGEVLLRLLAEVAAAGEGPDERRADVAGQEGSTQDRAPDKAAAAVGGFMAWRTSVGALELGYHLLERRTAADAVPTRQAVLQVLLWCFFEVVPPQQQQQQQQEVDSTPTTDSSSSDALPAEHMQVLRVAAERGALWSSSQGEAPAAQLPCPCSLPSLFAVHPACSQVWGAHLLDSCQVSST